MQAFARQKTLLRSAGISRSLATSSVVASNHIIEEPSAQESNAHVQEQGDKSIDNAMATESHASPQQTQNPSTPVEPATATPDIRKKTMQELDDELKAKMENLAGDGGIAGAELENGKAVAMKRGVRENMYRVI